MLMRTKYTEGLSCGVEDVANLLRLLPCVRCAAVFETHARGEHFLRQLHERMQSLTRHEMRRIVSAGRFEFVHTGGYVLLADEPGRLSGLDLDLLVYDAFAKSEVIEFAIFRLEVTK